MNLSLLICLFETISYRPLADPSLAFGLATEAGLSTNYFRAINQNCHFVGSGAARPRESAWGLTFARSHIWRRETIFIVIPRKQRPRCDEGSDRGR